MKTIAYSEFAKMIDCRCFLDSVLRAVEYGINDLDSNFVLINDEVYEVITDEK